MKHLVLVGACYLDTILRQVICAAYPFISLPKTSQFLPAAHPVCLTSRMRMPSFAPQSSRYDGEETAQTPSRFSSSLLQKKIMCSYTWHAVCRTRMPPARRGSSRPLAGTPASTLGIVYTGAVMQRQQAATSSGAKRAVAGQL